MTHRHEAFGLAIRANRPLTGLPGSETERVDLEVDFAQGRAPAVDPRAGRTTARTGSGSVREREDGGRVLRFASHGGERAWSMDVRGDGGRIDVRWSGAMDLGDVTPFVEVSGLSTALALRRVPLLHGCAVDTGDGAFLALGQRGAGKSTLAGAAVRGGYALLTDDIAALDGDGPSVRVYPGGNQLRMFADTARALGWEPAELPRVFRTPELPPKIFLALSPGEGTLCDGARSLRAIFALAERRPGPTRIERLEPKTALATLLRNTYGDGAADAETRARLLPFWTLLARDVPLYAVSPRDGLATVPTLLDELVAAARTPQFADSTST